MIQYIEATPTADEFNTLTDSVGWGCTMTITKLSVSEDS